VRSSQRPAREAWGDLSKSGRFAFHLNENARNLVVSDNQLIIKDLSESFKPKIEVKSFVDNDLEGVNGLVAPLYKRVSNPSASRWEVYCTEWRRLDASRPFAHVINSLTIL